MSKSRQGITPTFSKGKRDTSSVQQTDPKRARTLMIITFPDCVPPLYIASLLPLLFFLCRRVTLDLNDVTAWHGFHFWFIFLFVLVVVFVHLVFVVVFCFVFFFLWLSKIVLTKSTRKNSTMNNTKGACENVVGIVYCVEHVFSEKLPIRPIGPSLRLQRLCEKQVPQRPTK